MRCAASLSGMRTCKSKCESQHKKRLRRIHSLPRSYSSSSDLSSDESPVFHRQRASSTSKKIKYRSVSPLAYYKRARHSSRSPSYDMVSGPCGCCRGKMRKYKRESDCSCFRDDALCENYIHVANTSNEDWIVANCTPKKRTLKKRRAYSEELPKRSRASVEKRDKMASSKGLSFDISGISPFSSTVLSLQNSNKNYAQKAALSKIEEEGLNESKGVYNASSDGEPKKKEAKIQIEEQSTNAEKIEKAATPKTTKHDLNVEPELKTSKRTSSTTKYQTKEKEISPIKEEETKKAAKTKKSVTNSKKKTTNNKKVEQNISSASEELAKAIEESKKTYAEEQKLVSKPTTEQTAIMEKENHAEIIKENVHKNDNSKSKLNNSSSNKSAMNNSNSSKKILVYQPGVTTDVEPKNGRVQITCEYLAKKIGEERARQFYKFYAGKKDFNAKLHVYFCPPASDHDSNAESESEDELFCFGKYGYLTEEK